MINPLSTPLFTQPKKDIKRFLASVKQIAGPEMFKKAEKMALIKKNGAAGADVPPVHVAALAPVAAPAGLIAPPPGLGGASSSSSGSSSSSSSSSSSKSKCEGRAQSKVELVHSIHCIDPLCAQPNCQKMKRRFKTLEMHALQVLCLFNRSLYAKSIAHHRLPFINFFLCSALLCLVPTEATASIAKLGRTSSTRKIMAPTSPPALLRRPVQHRSPLLSWLSLQRRPPRLAPCRGSLPMAALLCPSCSTTTRQGNRQGRGLWLRV